MNQSLANYKYSCDDCVNLPDTSFGIVNSLGSSRYSCTSSHFGVFSSDIFVGSVFLFFYLFCSTRYNLLACLELFSYNYLMKSEAESCESMSLSNFLKLTGDIALYCFDRYATGSYTNLGINGIIYSTLDSLKHFLIKFYISSCIGFY